MDRADATSGSPHAQGDRPDVGPVAGPERIAALDVLRGFAVLGILVMNIQAFSMIGAAYMNPTVYGNFTGLNYVVWLLSHLLADSKFITIFSLLFGTTWLVNALAFFGILSSVLLAILINHRWPIRRSWPYYAGLFASLALAFVIPPESLLFDQPLLRYTIAAALAFAPVFFANLVFTYSFRDTKTADMAFASNLLGAMVGGALEYLALTTGYQALLLVVALLYGAAYLLSSKWRLLADKDLEAETETVVAIRDPEPAPAA